MGQASRRKWTKRIERILMGDIPPQKVDKNGNEIIVFPESINRQHKLKNATYQGRIVRPHQFRSVREALEPPPVAQGDAHGRQEGDPHYGHNHA